MEKLNTYFIDTFASLSTYTEVDLNNCEEESIDSIGKTSRERLED